MEEKKIEKIIIDCDPGTDDALAIILALNSSEIDLKAVCSVTGNGAIDTTTTNAIKILSLCHREDIPVYRGSKYALNNMIPDTVPAFGDDGLGGCAHKIVTNKIEEEKEASDFLVEYINSHPKEITLFAVGPCTNVAKAIRKSPDFAKNLKRLLIMGGAKSMGNMSPVAEYNFWADPLAAQEVLHAGIEDVVLVGLNVTEKIALDCQRREIIRLLGKELSQFIYEMTNEALEESWKVKKEATSSMHDVLTVAYFLDEEILKTVPANVEMVIDGVARGQSVVDENGFWNKGICNCKYAYDVDVNRFYNLIFKKIFDVNLEDYI